MRAAEPKQADTLSISLPCFFCHKVERLSLRRRTLAACSIVRNPTVLMLSTNFCKGACRPLSGQGVDSRTMRETYQRLLRMPQRIKTALDDEDMQIKEAHKIFSSRTACRFWSVTIHGDAAPPASSGVRPASTPTPRLVIISSAGMCRPCVGASGQSAAWVGVRGAGARLASPQNPTSDADTDISPSPRELRRPKRWPMAMPSARQVPARQVAAKAVAAVSSTAWPLTCLVLRVSDLVLACSACT